MRKQGHAQPTGSTCRPTRPGRVSGTADARGGATGAATDQTGCARTGDKLPHERDENLGGPGGSSPVAPDSTSALCRPGEHREDLGGPLTGGNGVREQREDDLTG